MLNTILLAAVIAGNGSFVDRGALQKALQNLAAASDGKVGICALDKQGAEPVCVHGSDPLPLQSVMKLVASAAVMDLVDQKKLRLEDTILIKPEHNSPGPQEFADLVRKKGQYPASIEELIRRSIVDSDSTSIDVLLDHIGGTATVQDFLKRKKLEGMRIDRNERTLQSDFSGLTWQASYAAPGKFEAAMNAVPAAQRDQALANYLKDPRDTATPAGMVKFLKSLASGQLLSETSTKKLLSIMEMTATGQDRLRAGLPNSWKIGHKTGTSFTWKGRAATTNDVGILTTPDGSSLAIAVFISDSRQSNSERAAIMAKAAQAVTRAWPVDKQKS
jgi:beta-lactamase class A